MQKESFFPILILVVSLQISTFTMHRVLIDDGSLADILYLSAYETLGVEETQLLSAFRPLVEFAEETILPIGSVLLHVTLGTYLAM